MSSCRWTAASVSEQPHLRVNGHIPLVTIGGQTEYSLVAPAAGTLPESRLGHAARGGNTLTGGCHNPQVSKGGKRLTAVNFSHQLRVVRK